MADVWWSELRRSGALEGIALCSDPASVVAISGHASRRLFFRLGWDGSRTAIAVVYPEGQYREVMRYIRTADWFRRAGVRVPHVLAQGERALLVQDVGPDLLDSYPRTGSDRHRCYRQAAAVLRQIQRYGATHQAPNAGWALDRERLGRELEFMERYTLAGWLGAGGGHGQRWSWYERLLEAIERLPQVICHRDFHARNLVVRDGLVWVLDFQDVMRGPLLYDHASLLWDNYCEVPSATQGAVLRACDPLPPLTVSAEAAVPTRPVGLRPAARQAFCLVALQRLLKALGTFGYQVAHEGNTAYATFVPRTWRHARTALRELGWVQLEQLLAPVARVQA